jgi:hypothetical protein
MGSETTLPRKSSPSEAAPTSVVSDPILEPVSAERQAELIRTYDSEANFRTLAGPVGMFVTTLAVVLSSFHVYTAGFGLLDEIKHRSFHLTLVLVLCFLVFPRERVSDDPRKAIGPWAWSLVFGTFYVYIAWALVARLGLAGTRTAWRSSRSSASSRSSRCRSSASAGWATGPRGSTGRSRPRPRRSRSTSSSSSTTCSSRASARRSCRTT